MFRMKSLFQLNKKKDPFFVRSDDIGKFIVVDVRDDELRAHA
jgi:hypothetical protein